MTTTANWGLTHMTAGQGSAEKTINAFLNMLDMFGVFRVKSASTNAEPGGPANGDCYILTDTPSGSSWDPAADDSTKKKIAFYYDGWTLFPKPTKEGRMAFVDDTGGIVRFDVALDQWNYFLPHKHDDALTATGTTQGAALALAAEVNRLTVVTGAANSVKLPSAVRGLQCIVTNADSADTANVFPFSGDQINALAVDAAFTLAAGVTARFYAMNSTNWYSF